MNLYLFLSLAFICHHANSFKIIKSTDLLSSSPSSPSLSSSSIDNPIIDDNSIKVLKENPLKKVIVLDGKTSVAFTDEKSPLVISANDANLSMNEDDEEEGVGVPMSFDYAKASPLDQVISDNGKGEEKTKEEFSVIHPIYVKPPQDFKPIIYPNRPLNNNGDIDSTSILHRNDYLPMIKPPLKVYPFEYPKGVSSWLFGGLRGTQRGSFWSKIVNDDKYYKAPESSPVEIISLDNNRSSKSLMDLLSITRNKPSLNTRNPYDFDDWLQRDDENKPPSIFIENIEFIPMSKDQKLSRKSIKPNYEFKSNFLKDLMTSDGGTSDRIFIDFDRNEKQLTKNMKKIFTATVILRPEPDLINSLEK